uniref:Protein kinase domain-containing protein n=1 Tax=Ditylenchus dipsaci TaxID=166011 RepID=A0A915DYC4_9BILA
MLPFSFPPICPSTINKRMVCTCATYQYFSHLSYASTSSGFNLFISAAEVNRTLGILAEMNYVEGGIINSYSTKFPYRINANVSSVVFTWSSAITSHKIKYSIRAIAEDFDVLPVIHLPLDGVLPNKNECGGMEDANSVASTAIVTPTQLLYLGVGSAIALVSVCGALLFFTLNANRKATEHRGGGRGLGSSFYSSIRRRTSGAPHIASLLHGMKDTMVFEDSIIQPFLLPSTSTPFSAKNSTSPKQPAFGEELPGTSKEPKIIFERRSNIVDVNHALVELNADRNLFVVMPLIELEGQFGEIRWANWRQTGIGTSGDIDDEEDDAFDETPLICKTLKHGSDRTHFEKFIKECLVFHNVPSHPNLAQVMAAATFGNFINPESVKRHLQVSFPEAGCSTSEVSATLQGSTLRTHDLVSMATQILKAIQHLHKFGIIHKDVATRNCLVSELPIRITSDRLIVQLCDYALSRDLFPGDYFLPSDSSADKDAHPVKWMAPETIRSNVYNSASDVWTYGVFLWELFTCGQQPFCDIAPEDMQIAIAGGTRLVQPYNCPDEIYGIMFSCWNHDPLKGRARLIY